MIEENKTQLTYSLDTYHTPVLLEESLDGLSLKPNGIYLDLTFGGGGHSKAILDRLGKNANLFGFDQDADAIANSIDDDRFTFIASNFRYLDRFMDYYNLIGKVDGILADLGVSSHHFDKQDRGFSFRTEEPLLDMRMNQNSKKSARDIIAKYDEEKLADILYKYGELKNSRKLARAIIKNRELSPINTIGDLLKVIDPFISPKERKRQLSQVFQALRIEVNDEMSALNDMLEACTKVLKKNGRLVVITYHSLEDRIVKNFLKKTQDDDEYSHIYGKKSSNWSLINRKAIVASDEELLRNPRSRSAKLRIAEWKS